MTAPDPHRAVALRGHCVHCARLIRWDTDGVMALGETLVAHAGCEGAWRARRLAARPRPIPPRDRP